MSVSPGMTSRPDDLHELEVTLLDHLESLESFASLPGIGRPESAQSDRPSFDLRRSQGRLLEMLFDAQVESRLLDHTARWLKGQGLGYYTIGSAGHESNAAVALALRPTDPALLHYRSGGFYCARARQVGGHDAVTDVLSGMLALEAEPIAGGRHKVFGHRDLAIIPQTSTIASHLPRAVGVAFAIGRARRLGIDSGWADDAVAVCSFGDAGLNHSTAQGAINTACYTSYSGFDLPLLFVCEDNGIGISVPTPAGWVAATLAHRPELRYAAVDGSDPIGVLAATADLAAYVRSTNRPAVLHLRTVRYLGHAGSDVEASYRPAAAIRAEYVHDPILATARELVAAGIETPTGLVGRYLAVRRSIRDRALQLAHRPTLSSADEVMAPTVATFPARTPIPQTPSRLTSGAMTAGDVTGSHLRPPLGEPKFEGLNVAETINRVLADTLQLVPSSLVFGEDVGVKGGVYGVTRGLRKRFGAARVFDSLLDEQSILGVALGTAISGFLPIPEIQYLAYLHNAEDQLRGEAASLAFFSNGQYHNGMVVRIASYAYQKGFGGHFHNDNAVAVLRDIPGLVIASPAHPSDVAPMFRACVAAARDHGTVSVFLEPIALYFTRDLFKPGDGVWTAPYDPVAVAQIGQGRKVRAGDDVVIFTWANGLHLSLLAARQLASEGISCRVFDVRWINPMPLDAMFAHAEQVGRVLVVDETRQSGGVGEGIVAGLAERGYDGPIQRVAARDSFIPLGEAANLVLVQVDDIVAAARSIMS